LLLLTIAYYLDKNWQHQEQLIGFEHLEGQYTGVQMASVVQEVLVNYKLEDHLFAVTTDNAANNGTMAEALEEGLKSALEAHQ
jgi:hypothetical protein